MVVPLWLLDVSSFTLFFMLLVALLVGLDAIKPVEKIIWAWKGLVFALVGGLVFALFFKLFNSSPDDLPFVLSTGLFVGLFVGLFGGLSDTPLASNVRLKPNQGIHTSGWNALRLGFAFFLFSGLLGGLFFELLYGRTFEDLPSRWLLGGLFFGLLGGLLGGLPLGGKTYVQHYILRLLLACSCTLPWRVVPFLEEARKCTLLQRVGGGYQFVHPLLQEYFAALAISPAAP